MTSDNGKLRSRLGQIAIWLGLPQLAQRDLRQDWRNVRRVFPLIRPSPRLIALGVLVLSLQSAIAVIFPILARHFTDNIVPEQNFHALPDYAVGAAVFTLVMAAISIAYQYQCTKEDLRLRLSLQATLLGRIIHGRQSLVDDRPVAYWESRVRQDSGSLSAFYVHKLLPHVFTFVRLGIYVVILIGISWKLSTALAVTIPISVSALALTAQRRRNLIYAGAEVGAENVAALNDVLANLPLVKRCAMEHQEEAYLRRRLEAGNTLSLELERLRTWISIFQTLAKTVVPILLQVWAFVMVARGQLSMGDVVAFLMYAAMLASQVQGLARTSTTFDTTLVAVERVLGVIDLSPELQTKADGTRQILTEPIREVRLERVGYRLPKAESETVAGLEAPPVSGDQGEAAEGGEWVLKDVDLVLTAGNPVALVGQSGAGKSTIARLLTGAIRPTEGRILVNGIDLCSLDLVSYRRQLSVVSHEDFLLGRDLLSNIYYRLESQTEGGSRLEKIKSALRMDQLFRRESLRAAMSGLRSCLKVGVAIPEELTRIRRWKVSAGERQRIALMRELLYNARFLILDEACSNLDGEVEKNLIDLLREKHAGLLLVISHRSSMVQEYSKIVLLQGGLGGSILERGSHNELIRRDAAYRRLFDPRGRAVSREGSSIAKELE